MAPQRPDVEQFLRNLAPAVVEQSVWPNGMHLEISAYLT